MEPFRRTIPDAYLVSVSNNGADETMNPRGIMESVNSTVETAPSKEEQSKTLQSSVDEYLKKGGTIETQPAQGEPRNRREKRAASGKSSKRKAAQNLAPSGSNSGINMSCWAGYRVVKGTRVEFLKKGYTPKKKVHAEVADLGSMQMKIFVDDKEVKIPKPYGVGNGLSFGLVTTEAWIRVFLCGDKKLKAKIDSGEHINKSTQCLKVSACQGWDALSIEYKGKLESVHDRYKRIQRNR